MTSTASASRVLLSPAKAAQRANRLAVLMQIRRWRALLGYLPGSDYGFKGFKDKYGNLVVERWTAVGGVDRAIHDGTVTFNPLAGTATIERDRFTVTIALAAVDTHRSAVVEQLRSFGFRIEGRTGTFPFTGKVA